MDVTTETFEQDVLERSATVPVVVDFWAEWCSPCTMLTPVLEQAVAEREGRVVLAKVDTDANQELAERYGCPVLGLFGGADHSIHPDDIESFRTELNRAGVANELIVYEGAPHSFFDRSQEQFLDACDDAWRRILSFIRRTA